jgi:hypothetical protein
MAGDCYCDGHLWCSGCPEGLRNGWVVDALCRKCYLAQLNDPEGFWRGSRVMRCTRSNVLYSRLWTTEYDLKANA